MSEEHIEKYRELLGDYLNRYEEHSIYPSELYFFWKFAQGHPLSTIVESGTYYGFTTRRLRLLFPDCHIRTYEKDKEHLKEALLREAIRDSSVNYIHGKLNHNLLNKSMAVIIDGPKKERAVDLAYQICDDVAFVAIHDMRKYLNLLRQNFRTVLHSGEPSEKVKRLDSSVPYHSDHYKYNLYGTVLAIVKDRI